MSNGNGQGTAETFAVTPDQTIVDKTLAEFSQRQAAIVAMRQRFTGLTCGTPKDYEATRVAIGELRSFRVEVDKRRKVLNADAQAWIKSVNAESKRLIEEAEAIETPLQEMKDKVDEEKARKKAELEAAQKKRLEDAARAKVEAEAARVKAEQAAKAEEIRLAQEKLAAERARIDAENKRLAEERERIEAERQAAAWRAELAKREEDAKRQAEEQGIGTRETRIPRDGGSREEGRAREDRSRRACGD